MIQVQKTLNERKEAAKRLPKNKIISDYSLVITGNCRCAVEHRWAAVFFFSY